MQLLLFFTYGVSLKEWKDAGILSREVQLYQELQKHGAQVSFLTYGGKEDLELEAELGGIRIFPLYTRMQPVTSRLLRWLPSLGVWWHFRKELADADLYKTNQMWGAWIAIVAKALWRKPLMVRCGWEQYSNALSEGLSGWRLWVIRWHSWMAYHAAHAIWLNTPKMKDTVTRTFRVPADKITVHSNYIDTSLFYPASSSPQYSDRVLFVGRLSEEKNISTLIEAIASTPFSLDIVGQGPLEEALKQQAQEQGANVRFLGRLPNSELPALYQQYPVYVLCSLYEGNPKALLEAMSCGLCVLGTKVSGIKEVIQSGHNGWLCEGAASSMREALEHLMSDVALQQSLGKQARLFIEEHCSLTHYVETELALYQSFKRNY